MSATAKTKRTGHSAAKKRGAEGSSKSTASRMTYAAAGVDIEAGDRLVDLIKPAVRRTHGARVMGMHGGFAGMFRLDFNEPTVQAKLPRSGLGGLYGWRWD